MNMRELALSRVGAAEWVIDHKADAAYLLLDDRPVTATLNFGMVNIDVDDYKQALGIELLTLTPPVLKRKAQ